MNEVTITAEELKELVQAGAYWVEVEGSEKPPSALVQLCATLGIIVA